jgi:hypothetical protein
MREMAAESHAATILPIPLDLLKVVAGLTGQQDMPATRDTSDKKTAEHKNDAATSGT